MQISPQTKRNDRKDFARLGHLMAVQPIGWPARKMGEIVLTGSLGSRRWLQRENPSHSIAVVRLPDCGGEQGCVRYETYCIGNFIRRGVIEHPSVANFGPVLFARSSTTNIQRDGIARVVRPRDKRNTHSRSKRITPRLRRRAKQRKRSARSLPGSPRARFRRATRPWPRRRLRRQLSTRPNRYLQVLVSGRPSRRTDEQS